MVIELSLVNLVSDRDVVILRKIKRLVLYSSSNEVLSLLVLRRWCEYFLGINTTILLVARLVGSGVLSSTTNDLIHITVLSEANELSISLELIETVKIGVISMVEMLLCGMFSL